LIVKAEKQATNYTNEHELDQKPISLRFLISVIREISGLDFEYKGREASHELHEWARIRQRQYRVGFNQCKFVKSVADGLKVLLIAHFSSRFTAFTISGQISDFASPFTV